MRYRVAAAAILAAVAVVAALGAIDALGWRGAVPDGEAPSSLLPGDPVAHALGLEDDAAFARAARAFRAADGAPRGFDNGNRRARARAVAAGALAGVAAEGDARLASQAHDLLGVLAAVAGKGSPPFAVRTGLGLAPFEPVEAARASFLAAIAADGANRAAKENLELLLRHGGTRGVRRAPGGGPGSRGGRGAGASAPGFGY